MLDRKTVTNPAKSGRKVLPNPVSEAMLRRFDSFLPFPRLNPHRHSDIMIVNEKKIFVYDKTTMDKAIRNDE